MTKSPSIDEIYTYVREKSDYAIKLKTVKVLYERYLILKSSADFNIALFYDFVTQNTRLHYIGCSTKRAYDSKGQAKREAKKVMKLYQVKLHPYKCSSCHKIHLTRKVQQCKITKILVPIWKQ